MRRRHEFQSQQSGALHDLAPHRRLLGFDLAFLISSSAGFTTSVFFVHVNHHPLNQTLFLSSSHPLFVSLLFDLRLLLLPPARPSFVLFALSSVPDHFLSFFEVEGEWSGILGVAEKEGRASVFPAQGRAGGSELVACVVAGLDHGRCQPVCRVVRQALGGLSRLSEVGCMS